MKFGGSCLVDRSAFKKILKILKIYKDEKKIVVASAFSGITELLLRTAQNVNNSRIIEDNIAKHSNLREKAF
jgi:aspartokinase